MEDITSEREIAEAMKSKVAIQCTKAAILVSSLKKTTLNSTIIDQNKNEENSKEMEEFKMRILKEKFKNKNLKFYCVTELLIQVMLLLSIWTMLVLLALN